MARKMKKPGDIKAGANIRYLDIPDDMPDCYFECEFVEAKEVGEKGNIATVWRVTDTDTNISTGTEGNFMLFPFQQHAETYFWREVFGMVISLRGKSVTQERLDKLKSKTNKALSKDPDNALEYVLGLLNEYTGKSARCTIERYTGKDEKSRTRRKWEPTTVEESDD